MSPEKLKNMISDSRIEYYKDKFEDKYTNLKNKSINVGFPIEKSNYPLYYIEDGEEKGLAIEYLKDVEKIMGLKTKKIFYSKDDKWENSDITVALTVESSIRDNKNYTNPYYTLTPVIFNRKEDGFINNLIEARKKRFAVVENSYYMDYLRKYLKEENFVYAKDIDETIEKVRKKEADYSVGDYKTLINKLYNTGYDEEIKIAGILDKKYDISMVVNDKQNELYEALKDISASFLNENMSKNIYLEKNSYETDNSNKVLIFSTGILLLSFFLLYKGKKV